VGDDGDVQPNSYLSPFPLQKVPLTIHFLSGEGSLGGEDAVGLDVSSAVSY
jgi:hypothetical protein